MAIPSRTPPSRPSRWRRLLRTGVLATRRILLLVGIALLFLHTPPGDGLSFRTSPRCCCTRTYTSIPKSCATTFLNLSLSLRNLKIQSSEVPELAPFATIREASVDLSLLQLLRGRYVVQSGRVSGIDLHYVVSEEGRDNVPRPPPRDPNQPSEPLDFLIDELTITRHRLRYENRPQRISVNLPVPSITVDGTRSRAVTRFDSRPGKAPWRRVRTAWDWKAHVVVSILARTISRSSSSTWV